MADENIVRMQERITFLEKTVEDLNEVVTGLNDKVSRLDKLLDEFRAEQEAAPDEPDMEHDVPPHYGDPRSVRPGMGAPRGRRRRN
jgi:uncharacterized coiled-coil protein SlyX